MVVVFDVNVELLAPVELTWIGTRVLLSVISSIATNLQRDVKDSIAEALQDFSSSVS